MTSARTNQDRATSRPVGWLTACCVLVLLAVSCRTAEDVDPVDVLSAGGGELSEIDLSLSPVADDPDPSVRAGAAAQHVECVHGVWQGLGSIDFGPPPASPDPDAALTGFVLGELFVLPQTGYAAAGKDDNRRLYTYSVDSSPKVAIVVADSSMIELDVDQDGDGDGWTVEAFATCDPAEYDPSVDRLLPMEIWLDRNGERVPTSSVSSFRGPEHCEWDSATFLTVDGQRYIRDPDGVLEDVEFAAPFLEDTELPADAMDTGYQRDTRQIWLSADRAVAYIVEGHSVEGEVKVEAWPSTTETFGCA